MILYVDTSALGRVLTEAREAPQIEALLTRADQLMASVLLRIELLRLAGLRDQRPAAEALLLAMRLIPLDGPFAAAETIKPSTVRTLDAIHLATAVALHADGRLDAMLTYDQQLAAGARHHGITVLAPT